MDGPRGSVLDRCMATRFAASHDQIKRPQNRLCYRRGCFVLALAASARVKAANADKTTGWRRSGAGCERIALDASSSKKMEQIVVVQLDIQLFIGATPETCIGFPRLSDPTEVGGAIITYQVVRRAAARRRPVTVAAEAGGPSRDFPATRAILRRVWSIVNRKTKIFPRGRDARIFCLTNAPRAV